jgi:hypothetical protein
MAINDLMLNPNDLLGFTQQVRQSDPYGIAASSLNAFQPDTRSFSAGELGATAFGKSFLSGLLGNYANERANRQLSSVVQALPQLNSDPYGMSIPEGVDSGAFNLLRGSAILKNAQKSAVLGDEKKTAVGDLLKTVLSKSVETGAMTPQAALKALQTGDFSALEGMDQESPKANPNSPLEKKTVELRTDFDKKEQVQNFNYVNRLSTQLDEILKNPKAVADSSLAKIAVQFIEPKLSVNAGEGAALAQSASIPEEYKAAINKALKGGTGLPDDVRFGLLDLARAAKVAHGKAYQQTFNLYKDEADRFGIPIERITNVLPLDLSGMDKPITTKLTAKDFAERAKADGVPIEQARAAWAQYQMENP